MQHSIFNILTFTHTPIAFMLLLIKPNLVEKGVHTKISNRLKEECEVERTRQSETKSAMKERKNETGRKSTRYDMMKMNGLLFFETGMNERNAHTHTRKKSARE